MPSLLSRLGNLFTSASLFIKPVILASVVVSIVITGAKQLELLEELELNYYDWLVQLRPNQAPDPRLLVVAITEEDIRALGKWPISDQQLDRLLEKIERYHPRVIGLDIYRDLPVQPGYVALASRLQMNKDIIAVCEVGTSSSSGVAFPPTVPEERLGFSDIVVDPGGVARRNLLTMIPDPRSPCPATHSFGLQLALKYLEKDGISALLNSHEHLQIGTKVFPPIEPNTGGYQNVDARGYQILLNYRSSAAVAQQATLTEVLTDQVDPNLIRNRVVIIGVTAASSNDYFNTPYSRSQQQDLRMSGVLVHAQMTSQILSAVLDNRSLIWVWPFWVEMLWLGVWSLLGGTLVWYIRHPLALVMAGGVALGGLVFICYITLWQGGWIPLVPPALALVATSISVIAYRGYRNPYLPQANVVSPQFNGADTVASNKPNWNSFSSVPSINSSQSGGKGAIDSQSNVLAPQTNAASLLGGRYNIIKVIGSGAFGQTYLAEDNLRPGKPYCVVKQLKPTHNDQRFLQVARRLFTTEAEALENLGKNNQIPQLLAYFEENQEFYLVQEFIKGHPLSDELMPGQQLSEPQVIALLKDLLIILEFIHSHNVIHRDIKPNNIIRREKDERLVLIDFGAVKQLQTKIAGEEVYTVAIGTSGYAPPEQLLGQPEFGSDIYALGMIAIKAVTGQMPTQLKKDAKTKEVIWRDYAQVSEELAVVLDKMVRYQLSDRYQSAAEVLQALQNLSLA